jgi:hypothetical protein
MQQNSGDFDHNAMDQQEFPDEEVKLVRPLAKINKLITDLECRVVDMRWILNDTFLMLLTNKGHVMIFDVLL